MADPVRSSDKPAALALNHLAKGYHHRLGAIGSAQVRQILDVDIAAVRVAQLGSQHRRPVGQRLSIA